MPNIKKWESYINRAKCGFEDGIFLEQGIKRYLTVQYDFSKWFMPDVCFKQVSFLRKYFYQIDSQSCKIPGMKLRQTEIELFDTAINILFKVHKGLRNGATYNIGSEYICPIAFLILGKNNSKISRHKIINCYALVNGYRKIYSKIRTFNIMKVYRKRFLHRDVLQELAVSYDMSINVVLAASISFLHDLVHFCGPDSGLFNEIYGNDSRGYDFDIWQQVHTELVRKKSEIVTYVPTTYKESPKCNYSEVEIVEIIDGSI